VRACKVKDGGPEVYKKMAGLKREETFILGVLE
jgi:hypothetical protein